MSRSYREPYVVDGYGTRRKRYAKNLANRTVRRKSIDYEIASGKAYRKLTNPWDICDFKYRYRSEPRLYQWGGYPEWVDPDPIWWYNRK
jgi:hypothetical protein